VNKARNIFSGGWLRRALSVFTRGHYGNAQQIYAEWCVTASAGGEWEVTAAAPQQWRVASTAGGRRCGNSRGALW